LQSGYAFVHFDSSLEGVYAACECLKHLDHAVVNCVQFQCEPSKNLQKSLQQLAFTQQQPHQPMFHEPFPMVSTSPVDHVQLSQYHSPPRSRLPNLDNLMPKDDLLLDMSFQTNLMPSTKPVLSSSVNSTNLMNDYSFMDEMLGLNKVSCGLSMDNTSTDCGFF